MGLTYKNSTYLRGSLFDEQVSAGTAAMLSRAGRPDLRLDQLTVVRDGARFPLLRPPDDVPHLTTFTLESILHGTGHDYVRVPLEDVWSGVTAVPDADIDVVLLSTTFIWNRPMLARAMSWARSHLPGVPVIAGGQYTNLKYMVTMADFPEVVSVVRGDAEVALPMLLDTMQRGGDLATVPNLVWRDGDRVRINPIEYVDIDAFPSPTFPHKFRIAPYESMRGCPFDCKFCSFPAASPKWRYKSAEKIRDDWVRYTEENGVSVIDAMDSTFTVPPTRLRRLMEILPAADIAPWACYSRANVITSADFIDALLAAHCFYLVIGFESMNDETLERMSKRVTAKQNRRALELLAGSEIGYTNCFMVGYPGEDPVQFEDTSGFLRQEYRGRFMLHQFSITDETMPLWADREELQIKADDPADPDSPWSHRGMTSDEARRLQAETLDAVRSDNDAAVLVLWQREYQHPLVRAADLRTNLLVEKAVERLAMVERDHPDPDRGAAQVRTQLDVLRRHGIEPWPDRSLGRDPVGTA
ncbi:MAG: B12-binding domain-containing radical SAM protein [Labedaea sp.]